MPQITAENLNAALDKVSLAEIDTPLDKIAELLNPRYAHAIGAANSETSPQQTFIAGVLVGIELAKG